MLTVYAAAWCPHCTKTVEFLKKHGIAFTYMEIEDQPEDVIDKIIQVNGGDDWVVPTLAYNGKWREGRFYNERTLLSDLKALGVPV
ncbi:glutaredoxin family protein [Desulfotignum phosphitoxidans]|jgi:mycoredoxin|uniref:Glutaredoxin GrxC n=1 Tax=Desulfotignum phosphitoxidans DSM 13687 TaxID=1286635 RepID=S0G2I8_9BACT|nr:glutaredoxin family protein [Desulfotignum phosphitoxidans]EMS77946.1 glutaredoxin GrxC [Desulfotignum phosphitoxidans DSM 13687]